MKNNEFDELFKRINLLDNRLNIESQRYNLYSILPEYILSFSFFPTNNDIKYFIVSVGLDSKFKEYLYASRTLLLARLIRIISSSEKEMLILFNNVIKDHILEFDSKDNPNKDKLVNLLNKYSRKSGVKNES